MSKYDAAFFEMNRSESMSAALAILPWVLNRTSAKTVIDLGSAEGCWLSVAKAHGCSVHGVDGFADPGHLLIDQNEHEVADLTSGYDCTGYDLALCTEVGEHLPESAASALVAGLCKARYVLFSAAIPGQGGVDHINEQWQSWWARLFGEHDYYGSLKVRETFWTDTSIECYYRQNIVFYEHLNGGGVTDVVHPELFTYKMGLR